MRRLFAAFLTAAAAFALVGCGSSPTGSAASPHHTAPSTSGHNAADVTFMRRMIPHHAQAINMAKLAATRAASPQVKALASRIEAAQNPQIQTMTGCLANWGQPMVMPSTGMMNGNSTNGMMNGANGMMSGADMAKLGKLSGRAFDRQFLTMMTAHHRGAIAMARTEQTGGRYRGCR
jgi:uncharacterized protein (DUF305 family)